MDEKDEKQAFSERLVAAVEAAGYQPRPSVVEKHFNELYWGASVTFQGVSRWLKGHSIPEQDKLVVLAEWLNVEPHELRYGVAGKDTPKSSQPWYVGLSIEESKLFQAFLKLPADKKKIVRDVIVSYSESTEN